MTKNFYTAAEKSVVHNDGWQFFVRDGDEGMVTIGYKEWREGDWVVVGEPLSVPIEFLSPLIDAMQSFT